MSRTASSNTLYIQDINVSWVGWENGGEDYITMSSTSKSVPVKFSSVSLPSSLAVKDCWFDITANVKKDKQGVISSNQLGTSRFGITLYDGSSIDNVGNAGYSYIASQTLSESYQTLSNTFTGMGNIRNGLIASLNFSSQRSGTNEHFRIYAKDINMVVHWTVYTVSVTAGAGGTVTGGGEAVKNQVLTLKATPNSGYKFVKWSDGNTNATRTVTVTADASYTAQFEVDNFARTWDYDGGTYDGKTSLSESISASASSTSLAQFKPIKQGYEFVGWDKSYDGGYITQDGFKGYTSEHNSDWQVSINSDYSTKYKLNASGFTANTWRNIRFGNYDVTTSSNITVKGWIRLISTPVSLNFYHGDKSNDYTNNKKQLTPSNADGKWQYFSITRDVYAEATSTGCFEIFTGNLVNTEGTIEFDLREVQIIDNNTGAELLPLKTGQLSSNITIKALYRTAAYVTYDSILSFAKWKSDGISASNATVSDITDTSFTLTSNAGVAEGLAYSPFFPVEYGKSYKIDIDITGTNWDVYIFFCDDGGNWVDFADSTNRFSSNGTGVTSRIFTAPNKSSVVKAQIRVDANNASNTVSFANFRIYPAAYEYMSNSVSAAERTDIGSWSMPTPTRSGYSFTGWNSKPDGSGTVYTASNGFPIEDMPLYSQWKSSSKTYIGTLNDVKIFIGTQLLKGTYIGTTKVYG